MATLSGMAMAVSTQKENVEMVCLRNKPAPWSKQHECKLVLVRLSSQYLSQSSMLISSKAFGNLWLWIEAARIYIAEMATPPDSLG